MIQNLEIDNLRCRCTIGTNKDRIAYLMYPMDLPPEAVERFAGKYDITIVVVTGMDWESVFSPWPAKGVPKGSPDFKGRSPEFLELLREKVIPKIEDLLSAGDDVERTLVGVSMSGLFALWQWMTCDTFRNIISLSGSFWYEGFVGWMEKADIPCKAGKAFFLLGNQEAHSKVKAFRTVASDTETIVTLLKHSGIATCFESVPGDHFAAPLQRLETAFATMFP